jgi:beta-lactamase regulating signal transducer with metallopeptidase domain
MIEPAVLLESWATTMWRACWQGSLVVLAVWSICRVIPSMPARFHCWFWRLAILKFAAVLLLPFAFDVPLLPAPAAYEITAPLEFRVAVSDVNRVPPSPIQTRQLPPHVWLCLGWGIGVGWNLARLLTAWHAVGRLRRRSHPVECLETLQLLNLCRRLFGLRSEPELLEVAGCGSPVLVGILRPAIVVPAETRRRLNASEQAMVFGHELAHIRHGDLLWALVAALVRCVFFFHPLVWLSERQLKMAQEMAADELAIAHQDHDPIRYGRLLVSVLSKLGSSRVIPTTSMGMAGPMHSLKRRLSAMSFYGQVSRRVVATSAVLLGAVVLLGLAPWRIVAADPANGANPLAQRIATIKISEGEAGKPLTVVSAPRVVFIPGSDAVVIIGDKKRRVDVTIRSNPDKQPVEHEIEIKLTRDPKGENPDIVAAPKITLLDGATGKIRVEGLTTLEVEATVKPAKAAGKAETKKRAKEATITLYIAEVPVDKALDMIAEAVDIPIKKRNMPKSVAKVSAEFEDVPVLEAIRFLAETANLKYTVVDDGIEVSGKKKP